MSHRIHVTDDRCGTQCVHPETVAEAQAQLEDSQTYRELAEVFGALADPTRARIVHTLLRQELCTCDLAVVVGISESGASQHLRILRSLRLVKSRRDGKFVYYTLDDAHIALLIQVGLTHLGHGDSSDIGGTLASLQNEGRA
ncbi:MAG: metalloregulator ArsR/SmtB family transcription factor [Chloroflexota bacterium]